MRSVPTAPVAAGDLPHRPDRRHARRVRLRLLALPLAALLVATASAGPVGATSTDAVLAWNTYAVEALTNPTAAGTPGAGQPPTVGAIHLAMVQTAVHDAVNAIVGGHEPYLADLPEAPATASVEAAVATAAHHVLVDVLNDWPGEPASVLDRVNMLYADALDAIADGAGKGAGIAIGAAAAAAMIDEREGDGRFTSFAFTVGTGPGEWRPTPSANDPFGWVANVRPFSLDSSSRYRTEGPLDMASEQYAKEFAEVKSLGSVSSTTRTADQEALGRYFTEAPTSLYNRTFRNVAAEHHLGAADAARLFASLNMAFADAIITCWVDKEYWGFWRPITAIRLADTDGNDATVADPSWSPLVGNPPYPDHPSGYNCATGAVFHSAKAFFGTDRFSFSVENAAGVKRPYERFTDVIDDTIDGRIYIGIHFRSADVQGAWIGKKTAQWVASHEFAAAD